MLYITVQYCNYCTKYYCSITRMFWIILDKYTIRSPPVTFLSSRLRMISSRSALIFRWTSKASELAVRVAIVASHCPCLMHAVVVAMQRKSTA